MRRRAMAVITSMLLLGACGAPGPQGMPLTDDRAMARAQSDMLAETFRHADRNRDSALSLGESGLNAEQFRVLDRDGNQLVTRSEWEARLSWAALARHLKAFAPLVRHLREALDRDRDGRVSQRETQEVLGGRRSLLQPLLLDRLHAGSDGDRDGQLDAAEFDRFYMALGTEASPTDGITASVVRALLGAYLGVTSHIATPKALHPPRQAPRRTPRDLGMPHEDLTLRTSDGLTLQAWFVPAKKPSKRAVIAVHGHANSRGAMLEGGQIGMLHPEYHVLAFDLRAHGESEGTAVSFGYHEGKDVLAAIAHLRARGLTDISLYGVSLGGASVIRGAALDPGVRAVVDDCAFNTVHGALQGFIAHARVPASPLVAAATLAKANRELGIDMSQTEPNSQVSRLAPRPFLVIHGEKDNRVSPDHSRANYEAAGPGLTKELWIVPGAGHANSSVTAPEAYRDRLLGFLRRRD